MNGYVNKDESIVSAFGYDTKQIAKTITNRYMNDNPICDYTFRVHIESKIIPCEDFRYDMDFEKIFPDMKHRQKVFAYTKLWSTTDKSFIAQINTNCPFGLYLNGESVYKSSIHQETDFEKKFSVSLKLNKGWNFFTICMTKVNSGCRAVFGGAYQKFGIVNFLVPVIQREGQAGFVYTAPQSNEINHIISRDINETQFNIFPVIEEAVNNYASLFGCGKGYAIAKADCIVESDTVFSITVNKYSAFELYADGGLCYSSGKDGIITIDIPLKKGKHHLIVKSHTAPRKWGFAVKEVKNGKLVMPNNIKGGLSPWILLGIFERDIEISEFTDIHKLIEDKYWITPIKNSYIRAYQEDCLYGLWNYPLGVALYGFFEASQKFGFEELIAYAIGHINLSTSMYEYAKWEREKFVTTYVNQQISEIDMLDDCGSFGMAMLTACEVEKIVDCDKIAEEIADYILNKQEKNKDGAFIRIPQKREFMKHSIWADDLFMGSSFLIEYYKKSKDIKFLDLAAKQYKEYKKYLWIDNTRLLSHVYSLRYKKANLITWGRGLGWVVFSLSRLLEVLPDNHSEKEWLVKFFADLCEEILKYQSEDGLWHQVVDDETSYYETSCTAMYLYAIIKGINNGFLKDNNNRFKKAALNAWKGICNHCIDKNGNIYGVCRGSGYSFDVDYYKNDLTPVINDTHGIGIVLLAALEISAIDFEYHVSARGFNSGR